MLQTLAFVLAIIGAGLLVSGAIYSVGGAITTAIHTTINAHADRVEASARKLEETIYSEVARISQKL